MGGGEAAMTLGPPPPWPAMLGAIAAFVALSYFTSVAFDVSFLRSASGLCVAYWVVLVVKWLWYP